MRKILALTLALTLTFGAYALTVFSTSTDWEAVTGLRASEFRVEFGLDRSVTSIGMELYFLDGFPCFGQSESARVWIAPAQNIFRMDTSTDSRMRIVCLYAPAQIKLAYREMRRDAGQGRTTGLKICPTTHSGRNIRIDLRECNSKGRWNDMR